ncbi:hypothetical protein ACLMJK_007246 [Lecanora helva]
MESTNGDASAGASVNTSHTVYNNNSVSHNSAGIASDNSKSPAQKASLEDLITRSYQVKADDARAVAENLREQRERDVIKAEENRRRMYESAQGEVLKSEGKIDDLGLKLLEELKRGFWNAISAESFHSVEDLIHRKRHDMEKAWREHMEAQTKRTLIRDLTPLVKAELQNKMAPKVFKKLKSEIRKKFEGEIREGLKAELRCEILQELNDEFEFGTQEKLEGVQSVGHSPPDGANSSTLPRDLESPITENPHRSSKTQLADSKESHPSPKPISHSEVETQASTAAQNTRKRSLEVEEETFAPGSPTTKRIKTEARVEPVDKEKISYVGVQCETEENASLLNGSANSDGEDAIGGDVVSSPTEEDGTFKPITELPDDALPFVKESHARLIAAKAAQVKGEHAEENTDAKDNVSRSFYDDTTDDSQSHSSRGTKRSLPADDNLEQEMYSGTLKRLRRPSPEEICAAWTASLDNPEAMPSGKSIGQTFAEFESKKADEEENGLFVSDGAETEGEDDEEEEEEEGDYYEEEEGDYEQHVDAKLLQEEEAGEYEEGLEEEWEEGSYGEGPPTLIKAVNTKETAFMIDDSSDEEDTTLVEPPTMGPFKGPFL